MDSFPHCCTKTDVVIPKTEPSQVVQWVKHWPADLAFPSFKDRNLFSCERGPITHSLILSPFHPPDMAIILLERT